MTKLPEYKGEIDAEYARECLSYNSQTGEFQWKTRPCDHFKTEAAWKGFNTQYAGKSAFKTIKTTRGNYSCLLGKLDGYIILAHQMAWLIHYGNWPRNEIDHISGNALDNRIDNLADATRIENTRNNARSRNNTSGQVGVCWHRKYQKWTSYISNYGKKIHLGNFDTFEDAVAARKKAEPKYGYSPDHGREPLKDLSAKVADVVRVRIKARQQAARAGSLPWRTAV